MIENVKLELSVELSVCDETNETNETKKVITMKEKELPDMRSETSAENGEGDTSKELAAKLEVAGAENQVMPTIFADQISLTKKAEIALDTQKKLNTIKMRIDRKSENYHLAKDEDAIFFFSERTSSGKRKLEVKYL